MLLTPYRLVGHGRASLHGQTASDPTYALFSDLRRRLHNETMHS